MMASVAKVELPVAAVEPAIRADKCDSQVVMIELVPNLICDLVVNDVGCNRKQATEETELGPSSSSSDDNDFSSPITSDSEQCQSLDSDKLLDSDKVEDEEDDDDQQQQQLLETDNVPKIEENNHNAQELTPQLTAENDFVLKIAAVIAALKKQVSPTLNCSIY